MLFRPAMPPWDPLEWARRPFTERARMVCEAWALQGYGTPLLTYSLHLFKVAFYVGMWVFFCSFSPGLGRGSALGAGWLSPVAFEKAILWSMLFEGLGLGCGSGPLTGRYAPPIGGFLHFLRPGTTKLPLFPGAPLFGGVRRTWLDVGLYLLLVAAILRALVTPTLEPVLLLPIAVLVPVIGLADRTVFLALRAEHYWTTVVCLATSSPWIAGAKAVQLALWFWAGVSKLNHHFPTVVCVMMSNSPFTRFAWLRKKLYRRFPEDLRPSRLAVGMSHMGTALELAVPLLLGFAHDPNTIALGLALMLVLHAFILINVPMGVPIEWNVMVVYGGFALFAANPEARVFDVGSPALAGFLVVMLVGLPLAGNLFPDRLSFLIAMRFYAGNWPFGVWLFRGDSHRKLDGLTKASPWIFDQVAHVYDRATSIALGAKVMAFRLMHLEGRALLVLLPKAVDGLEAYEYVDGEIIAGLVLGWNFGDGHLHDESLLRAVQAQCGFEAGELRCIFVEGQPLGRSTMSYRIHDAKTGLIERGDLDVRVLREWQPWSAT